MVSFLREKGKNGKRKKGAKACSKRQKNQTEERKVSGGNNSPAKKVKEKQFLRQKKMKKKRNRAQARTPGYKKSLMGGGQKEHGMTAWEKRKKKRTGKILVKLKKRGVWKGNACAMEGSD